ncbi:MAG: hypothetical protein ACYDBZ_17215 [Steroidobacteraceae bacterium]
MENSGRVMYRKVATANVRFRESIRPLCVCSKDGFGSIRDTGPGYIVTLIANTRRVERYIGAQEIYDVRAAAATSERNPSVV